MNIQRSWSDCIPPYTHTSTGTAYIHQYIQKIILLYVTEFPSGIHHILKRVATEYIILCIGSLGALIGTYKYDVCCAITHVMYLGIVSTMFTVGSRHYFIQQTATV